MRPTGDDISETVLTEECKIQTGLSEEAIQNAQPLEYVLDEVCTPFTDLLIYYPRYIRLDMFYIGAVLYDSRFVQVRADDLLYG